MSKENTARNARVNAERHNLRMVDQAQKVLAVPRGTARALRRKHLAAAYAKRQAA